MRAPRVGAVVVTRDRPCVLDALADLVFRTDPPEKVVVVDNASTTDTPDLVAKHFPSVKLLRLGNNLGAAARNVGVEALSTPYVAFCDDDMSWRDGALAAGAALLDRHPRLAVVAARVLVGPQAREDPVCQEMAESPLTPWPDGPGRPVLGFLAGASLVRRQAFQEAGGFEPRYLIGGEEQLMAMCLAERGWRLAYVDSLVAHHHPSPLRDLSREWIQLRNRIWTYWLRRSPGRAIRLTADTAARAVRDRTARKALGAATLGAVWALRRRRRLPDQLDRDFDLIER